MTTEAERLADALPPLPVATYFLDELTGPNGELRGVWLGCDNRSVTEQAHTPGETTGEINEVFTADQMRAYALQALRTQAAALTEREWRPIETAPLDVSPVLLGNADEGWREQGFYDTERREWWAVNTDWTDAHGMPLYPTHWQPLAAAPSPNKETTK